MQGDSKIIPLWISILQRCFWLKFCDTRHIDSRKMTTFGHGYSGKQQSSSLRLCFPLVLITKRWFFCLALYNNRREKVNVINIFDKTTFIRLLMWLQSFFLSKCNWFKNIFKSILDFFMGEMFLKKTSLKIVFEKHSMYGNASNRLIILSKKWS